MSTEQPQDLLAWVSSGSEQAPTEGIQLLEAGQSSGVQECESKTATAEKLGTGGNDGNAHQIDEGTSSGIGQMQMTRCDSISNPKENTVTMAAYDSGFNLAWKIFIVAAIIVLGVMLAVIAYKIICKSDQPSRLYFGSTSAAPYVDGKILHSEGLTSKSAQPEASPTAGAPALEGSSLVKLALNLTSVPQCSEQNLSSCRPASKSSWLRLRRENANLGPLECLPSGQRGGCALGNPPWLRLNASGIVILSRGIYDVRVQVTGSCIGPINADHSVSLILSVNQIVKVNVAGSCSINLRKRLFTVQASIGLHLKPEDLVQIKLESMKALKELELEVKSAHSMTFVQVSRR